MLLMHVMLCYDVFSKYVKLYPLKRANSRICAKKLLDDYVKNVCEVRAILTDNASIFVGKAFTDKVKEARIRHYHCSKYYPQSNLSERGIKELGVHLRIMYMQKKTKWLELLAPLERMYNETRHAVIGFKPVEVMAGRLQQTIHVSVPTPVPVTNAERLELEQIHQLALKRIRRAAEKRKQRHEAQRKGILWEPEIGSEVLLRNKQLSNRAKKRNRRLLAYYVGPYLICQKYGTDTYSLQDPVSKKIVGTYHKRFLKVYRRKQTE